MMDKDIYTDLNNIITQIPGWMDAEDLRIEPIVDILIGAMVGLVAIVALVVAFSWVFARLWCKPKRESPTRTPADYGLPFESISYSSHDVPVRGWFVPGESDAFLHPVGILAHGWSRNGAEMLPLASLLHEAGFAVLLMEALYERAPRERRSDC